MRGARARRSAPQSDVLLGRAAAPRSRAAFQPLRPGDDIRRARRQCGDGRSGLGAHRRLGDRVPERSGGIRRRRAHGSGQPGRASREARCGERDRVLVGQRAPRGAGDARQPPGGGALDPEPGARRGTPAGAVRAGSRGGRAAREGAGRGRGPGADLRLSQSSPNVGRNLGRREIEGSRRLPPSSALQHRHERGFELAHPARGIE